MCRVPIYARSITARRSPLSTRPSPAPHWSFWSAPRSPHSRRTSALCVRSARAYCRRRSRSRRRSTFRLPSRPTRRIFCPSWRNIFKKAHFTVLAKHAPDETGACYLYEFLAAHRRWKLHVTLMMRRPFSSCACSPVATPLFLIHATCTPPRRSATRKTIP